MLKLMKYEFRKTWLTKLIILGAAAIAEVVFLIGLYSGSEDRLLPIGIILLTLLAFGGIMVIGLESILTLHRDMNTKQSYMLFMTPNSCYKILGAKVLENGLSIALAGTFFFALGFLDLTLLFSHEGDLKELWEIIRDLITAFNEEIPFTPQGVGSLVFSMLCAWILVVSTACLADVISSALLNGWKYNGIVSFLVFLAISGLTLTQGTYDFTAGDGDGLATCDIYMYNGTEKMLFDPDLCRQLLSE